ncbi:MAG: lysophospholipid acyltransferase family protein [Acidimicrobiales bacterium]
MSDARDHRSPSALAEPRPPTRGELRLYRFCRAVAVGVSRLFFPGRVLGQENLPATGAFILAPVHRSYLDWLLVARVTNKRRLRFIAKAEIWKSKLIGRFIEANGAFPVHRSGADREALERCRSVLAGGEPLVMFPEGTRRSGPKVEDLREGVAYLALRAGVPVVPVGIGGSERAMPRGSAIPKPRRIDLVIGQPILPPQHVEPEPATAGDEASGTRSRARVSRRAMKEFSDQLGDAIQVVFDEAEQVLATTTIRGTDRR